MDIDRIRALVRDGAYLVKRDVILHAIKEGFNRDDVAAAILSGRIIEEYPERERVLICGRNPSPSALSENPHCSLSPLLLCPHAPRL